MNAAFGRYRLLERLGQGGMAEVFKAKSYGVEGFEKVLVIKRILPELGRSQEFVDMFIHEAKLAVRLSHANIVQVFDLGKTPAGDAPPGTEPSVAYYIAMEYVHGLDLASFVARCRRQQIILPIQLGVYVASEVAKGLDHAHRRRAGPGAGVRSGAGGRVVGAVVRALAGRSVGGCGWSGLGGGRSRPSGGVTRAGDGAVAGGPPGSGRSRDCGGRRGTGSE